MTPMPIRRLGLAGLACLCLIPVLPVLPVLLAAPARAATTALPVAPVRNVPETFFGTTVPDPYRDFENVKSPKVAAWMKAHSEHAHQLLKNLPGRAALRAALER